MYSSDNIIPVFSFTHLFLRTPLQSCVPAIAKIMKKNTKIMTVSTSKVTVFMSAVTIILRPSIPEIVLRGLNTLNDLSTLRLAPLLSKSCKYALATMMKSRIFQLSLR